MITLKTLPQATEQEVFDQVVNHLLTQGERSSSDIDGDCRYRYKDLKCAAGCLVSKEEYKEVFEGWTWPDLVRDHGVSENHEELIGDLQDIHDGTDPEFWEFALSELSAEYSLKFNYKS